MPFSGNGALCGAMHHHTPFELSDNCLVITCKNYFENDLYIKCDVFEWDHINQIE